MFEINGDQNNKQQNVVG